MGQIRGGNIGGGKKFCSKALLPPKKIWNGAPVTQRNLNILVAPTT